MPLPIIRFAKAALETTVDTTVALVSLPVRIVGLVGAVGALLERINDVVDRAERLVTEVEAVTGSAGVVVLDAAKVSAEASAVVAVAENTAAIANELIRQYEPIASRAAPLAGRFISELSEDEVEAAILLVDELPKLTEHLTTNILPILSTLDRVGPDVTELLSVTRDVRRAIAGIPGFGYFRRRGAHRIDGSD